MSIWKEANYLFSMSIFYVKNLFPLKNTKLGKEFLLTTLFGYFHFWNTLFSEIMTNFCLAPINPDQFLWKIIGVWFISGHVPTPCSFFGLKLLNCNHANNKFMFSSSRVCCLCIKKVTWNFITKLSVLCNMATYKGIL